MPAVDDFPNEEQAAVLESPARVVVVRAGPGSGKTRVFVEALRRRLSVWNRPRTGIAALSFTNVAKNEIENRYTTRIASPHFVGTLDSFVWRYIVRPFSHLLGVKRSGAVLVPAPVGDSVFNPRVDMGNHRSVSLFCCHASGGSVDAPEYVLRDPFFRARPTKPPELDSRILQAKRMEWTRSGRVTHSDCQYLAAAILSSPEHGDRICNILNRRFPEILIDEVQDTGWFLEQTVLRLLQFKRVKALVVGDPDQAIYEFAGANPGFFDALEALPGAIGLPISISNRCSRRVAAVASSLSQTGTVVRSRHDAGGGKAILISHQQNRIADLKDCLPDIIAQLEDEGSKALLARRNSVISAFKQEHIIGFYPGRGKFPKIIDAAVRALLFGSSSRATSITYRVMGELYFGNDTPSVDDLHELGIPRSRWRMASYSLLSRCATIINGETWNEWTVRARDAVVSAAVELGLSRIDVRRSVGRLFQASNPGGNAERAVSEVIGESEIEVFEDVSTIHGAKGREYDTVVIVCPKPTAGHPCPSSSWWPTDASSQEEKRIAFVATSRAASTVVLCVHEKTLEDLRANHADFFGEFETP